MAYALGPIGPDERHERIFVKRRSRRAVLILLAALVMAASAGGLLAVYRSTMRPGAEEVPLLRADNQPTRKRPDDPGGMQVPGQGTMILDHGHGEPKVEQLLPPPETPLPRPVATEPEPQPANVSPAIVRPALPEVEPTVSAPAPPPAIPPAAEAVAPTAIAPPPPPAKPAPPAAPPQIAAAPRTPVAGTGYRLQIGAVRTPEAAKLEWDRLKRHNSDVLGALGFEARRVDLGDRGIYFRIQAGPIADAAAAERDCSKLKRRGVGCILVKP
jgi:cell division protein FtsN